MTIATCYLCLEGVVLGADSTTSVRISAGPGLTGFHYFNHNQKLFELGENGTVGVLTWGLGSLDTKSYRTLLANFSDQLKEARANNLSEVVSLWNDTFWVEYSAMTGVVRCRALASKLPYGVNPVPGGAAIRTEQEEIEFHTLLDALMVGFCMAGYWLPDRSPAGFEMQFTPLGGKPIPRPLFLGSAYAWGASNLIRRLIVGIDPFIKEEILTSGKWNGTERDLESILEEHSLSHGLLPIRDAIDFVYTCIHSTIKAMKFSSLFQICGGPIELAVVTSDRRFRWVKHKAWDSAVEECE